MNAIDVLGLTKRNTGYPQFQKAVLLKNAENGVKRIEFKYSVITSSKFTLTATGMPGLDLAVPTKTIRTSRLDIAFVMGDSVEIDGRIWTVADLEYVYENTSAQVTGRAEKAWVLYLNGGKGIGNE